jgi:acetolactate synthase I/II/III large subunit
LIVTRGRRPVLTTIPASGPEKEHRTMTARRENAVAAAGSPMFATTVVQTLSQLGVRQAFGICGREIVPLWAALLESAGTLHEITAFHTRHESGAGYAAIGSWAQSGRPAAVFTTTGPGITNAITSLYTGRAASAKIVLLTPLTPSGNRGKLGIQDTSSQGYCDAELYSEGRLFDVVTAVESPADLAAAAGRLASGFAGPGGFMAHIAIPTTLQRMPGDGTPRIEVPMIRRPASAVAPSLADEIVDLLADAPFTVWVGWGARHHAPAIRRLLDLTGAPVMSTPRGLGIADRHAQFIGVTGNGGRSSVLDTFEGYAPARTLVLGTGMGQPTSGWSERLVPAKGFVHVDLDASVFGRAYPQASTLAVQADVGELLAALLARASRLVRRAPVALPKARRLKLVPATGGPVHPAILMDAIQRVVVEATSVPVLADAASAMFWAARHLVLPEPGRWVVENRFGAMGNAAAGVVGVAAARDASALAIVGDGAMHMQDEINTAAHYGIRAIWVVLNDSGMGIVRNGMKADGWGRHDADYPTTDFAAVAAAKGARGVRVTRAEDLDAALTQALEADGPFVVDVEIDPSAVAPIGARTESG